MKFAKHTNLGENVQMALTTLRENKTRSFLTVLGVVIGITALLSVVSILVGVYGDVNAYRALPQAAYARGRLSDR